MITLGVDAHKQVHAAVALDAAGRELGRWRGANSAAGWAALRQWAAGFGTARQWGIEGAWSYGRGLAQHLVAAGEAVYEINPRWTAQQRRRGRRRDKTDALDARAVALLVWREAAALPRVQAEDETAVLDLLVTEREDAIAEATRLRNQLHHLLLQLDPAYGQGLRTLDSAKALAVLEQYPAPTTRSLDQARGDRAPARPAPAAGAGPGRGAGSGDPAASEAVICAADPAVRRRPARGRGTGGHPRPGASLRQ